MGPAFVHALERAVEPLMASNAVCTRVLARQHSQSKTRALSNVFMAVIVD